MTRAYITTQALSHKQGLLLATVREKDFLQQVIDLARLRGWLVTHFRPAQNRRSVWATHLAGDPGSPDLIAVKAGRVVVAELKSERGRISPEQHVWLEAWRAVEQGSQRVVRVFLWRPGDWPEIETVFL